VLRLIFFAVETDTSAAGDVDGLVVKRIIKFRQAATGTRGGGIDFRGALHVESLVRPPVEALESTCESLAFTAFQRLFQERGLPCSIRSDNGVSFASPNSLFNE
jgi:hypothetical protein